MKWTYFMGWLIYKNNSVWRMNCFCPLLVNELVSKWPTLFPCTETVVTRINAARFVMIWTITLFSLRFASIHLHNGLEKNTTTFFTFIFNLVVSQKYCIYHLGLTFHHVSWWWRCQGKDMELVRRSSSLLFVIMWLLTALLCSSIVQMLLNHTEKVYIKRFLKGHCQYCETPLINRFISNPLWWRRELKW